MPVSPLDGLVDLELSEAMVDSVFNAFKLAAFNDLLDVAEDARAVRQVHEVQGAQRLAEFFKERIRAFHEGA